MLTPPFPYFGSKRAVADVIWQALGNPGVYIEPFLGSASILLARPHEAKVETVNDACCFLSNFWRALQHDPEDVAQWADYPVSEVDLHARHRWLVQQEDFLQRMRTDPDYFDTKLAGWWVWGLCCWIGHGWCQHPDERKPNIGGNKPGNGVHRATIPLVDGWHYGRGIHQKRPIVAGDRNGNGIHSSEWAVKPAVQGTKRGQGIHGKRPHIQGDHPHTGFVGQPNILPWFTALATRLRRVRICCGDWRRVLTPVVLEGAGSTGIVLDPPYSHQERDRRLYAHDEDIAHEVATWALHHGDNPKYRIVLCGYEGHYDMPPTWRIYRYAVNGGYGNQGNGRGRANAKRECLWFSPFCERVTQQLPLFEGSQGSR